MISIRGVGAALAVCLLFGCVERQPVNGGYKDGKEAVMVEKFVVALGKKLRYFESGSGIPIVYVHGNTGSSRWYGRVMDLPGYRTLALDLPNFGKSEALDIADIDAYADHLAAFIAVLGLDRPIVVGHSLGGAVVMSMAARKPDIARAIVIVDGAAPSGLVTPEAHYQYIEMYRVNRDLTRKALASVAPTLKDDALLDGLADDAMLMAGHAFSGNARALARFDYTGRAGAFKGPVLVIWGRKDIIITEAMARETAEAYGDSRLEILDHVGHSAMVEDPALFRKLIAEFCEKVK